MTRETNMKTKLQIRDLPAAPSIPNIPAPVVPQLRDIPAATYDPLAGLKVGRTRRA